MRQGVVGADVSLVLDGVVRVDRDGEQLAEYGPGALLGERAYLEGGIRTSTLVAATACRIAAVPASQFDTDALAELATGHRRTRTRSRATAVEVRINVCGTRGSTPAPGREFVRYGGHTSCLAITPAGAAGPELLLDAGTGIREVTGLLAGRPFLGTIAVTHLHWDHVHGLPFFAASDRDDAGVAAAPARMRRSGHRRGCPGARHVAAELPDHPARAARQLAV